MFERRTPLWALCCLALAASTIGVDARVMFVATPRGQRVERDVDATYVGASTPTMTSWHVATHVLYRYAKTTLATRLVNPASVAKEISFSAVLPQAAFISAFHIEMDGKVYDAYVKEKEAARREYNAARSRGYTAATVVKARDSNLFTVSVNVEAAGKVTFNLTYEEMLTRKLGLYHHVINIDPGQVVPDMSLRVRIEDALPLANLSVPALRTSNEIDNTDGVTTEGGASGPASISRPTPEVAVVEWTPSAEEQRSLRSEGLRAQLVVQYDVDRENNSAQILLSDGYFVHFYAPTTLTPLRKHVVFVMDVSGSMSGQKMPQMKESMATVLADLLPGDSFSIVLFESRVEVWQPNGTMFTLHRYHNEVSVPAESVVAVNADNIALAKAFVAQLEPLGGTNIHDALMIALEIVKLGRRTLRSAKVGEVPEPLIVFLTDGQPNEGAMTLATDIVRVVTAKNKRRTPIFSLAFGSDADLGFLKQLALANAAFAKLIYEAGDAALQLRDFYRQVASPLLANVTFLYEPEQVDNSSLTTLHFGTLFAGSELVVAGRLAERAPDAAQEQQRLLGVVMAKASTGKERYGFPTPKVAVCPMPEAPLDPSDAKRPASFMERLWAHLTVQQLLDKERAAGDPANSTGRTRALELALKYSFVTSLTSLVVVKPNDTTAASDPVEAGADSLSAQYPGGMRLSAPMPPSYRSSSSGSQGYPGVQGYSGSQGYPGVQGYSGSQGYPGVQGYSVSQSYPNLQLSQSHHFPALQSIGVMRPQAMYDDLNEADADYDTSSRMIPRGQPDTQDLVVDLADLPTYAMINSNRKRLQYRPPSPPPPPPPPPARWASQKSRPPRPTNASSHVQLTLSDITWSTGFKNATHVFVSVVQPGTGTTATTAFAIGTGQPDVDTGICPSVGEVGHCRHLPYCVLPDFKDDYSKYVATYFCPINGYAGVCCPNSHHAPTGTFSP